MKKTRLNRKHHDAGARMIDFGGWEMPVIYQDITSEHEAVRQAVGLFDLGHMGRISVRGPQAEELVQGAQTNDLERIAPGQIRYALLTKDDGGVIDDILVHRRSGDIFLVVNASNYERDVARLRELGEGMDVVIEPLDDLDMVAVQGPRAAAVLKELVTDIDVDGIGYYRLAEGKVLGHPATVTRTGYTGEDGFEVYIHGDHVGEVWDAALEAGEKHGIVPCGLGARDTLRLEAGMPLYGHEIDETINPVEAGLMFGVRLTKADYPGRDVLARVKKDGPKRQIVGLTLEGRRIPREGYPVVAGDEVVGEVRSGTWSPTFQRAIATALVRSDALDRELEVDLRGKRIAARRVDLPFYKRDGSGSLHAD
ncbi:MAG: glycine cleavage system aminomethyltransferase GcvT [Planctomycetota bacterium]